MNILSKPAFKFIVDYHFSTSAPILIPRAVHPLFLCQVSLDVLGYTATLKPCPTKHINCAPLDKAQKRGNEPFFANEKSPGKIFRWLFFSGKKRKDWLVLLNEHNEEKRPVCTRWQEKESSVRSRPPSSTGDKQNSLARKH